MLYKQTLFMCFCQRNLVPKSKCLGKIFIWIYTFGYRGHFCWPFITKAVGLLDPGRIILPI